MKVAFLGLGVMGYPMAGHLARAGHQVCVYNRTRAKAEQWVSEFGGKRADTPADAAEDADLVMMCVGNDDDVRSVAMGENGALTSMHPGSVLVDHTTASATLAEEIYQVAKKQGVGFLDAPVSGGQAGAETGQLTIMMGGDPESFEIASNVLTAYGKKVTLMGPAGFGQKTKMVNQLLIAGLIQGLAEGIRFAQKSGLDINTVVDVISGGAAQSWQLENRALTMAANKFDFGFAVDWMRKDLGLCFDEASKIGVDLPVAKLVDQFYEELQANGDGRSDTSSLIKRI